MVYTSIYTQRVKTAQLCVGLAVKNPSVGSLHKWSWKTVFLFCMGFSPGLSRVSADVNQLLYVIVGYGPWHHSVVELVFLHSIIYHIHICTVYDNCVLYPWCCYLCIYQQCFIHFTVSWIEENVQVWLCSLKRHLHK